MSHALPPPTEAFFFGEGAHAFAVAPHVTV